MKSRIFTLLLGILCLLVLMPSKSKAEVCDVMTSCTDNWTLNVSKTYNAGNCAFTVVFDQKECSNPVNYYIRIKSVTMNSGCQQAYSGNDLLNLATKYLLGDIENIFTGISFPQPVFVMKPGCFQWSSPNTYSWGTCPPVDCCKIWYYLTSIGTKKYVSDWVYYAQSYTDCYSFGFDCTPSCDSTAVRIASNTALPTSQSCNQDATGCFTGSASGTIPGTTCSISADYSYCIDGSGNKIFTITGFNTNGSSDCNSFSINDFYKEALKATLAALCTSTDGESIMAVHMPSSACWHYVGSYTYKPCKDFCCTQSGGPLLYNVHCNYMEVSPGVWEYVKKSTSLSPYLWDNYDSYCNSGCTYICNQNTLYIAPETIVPRVSIHEEKNPGDLSLGSSSYVVPNPASDKVEIYTRSDVRGQMTIVIYDVMGHEVSRVSLDKKDYEAVYQLNISGFINGMYSYQVVMEYQAVASGRFVVSH